MNVLKEFLLKIKTFQGYGYHQLLMILIIVVMGLISVPPVFPPKLKLFYITLAIAKYM